MDAAPAAPLRYDEARQALAAAGYWLDAEGNLGVGYKPLLELPRVGRLQFRYMMMYADVIRALRINASAETVRRLLQNRIEVLAGADGCSYYTVGFNHGQASRAVVTLLFVALGMPFVIHRRQAQLRTGLKRPAFQYSIEQNSEGLIVCTECVGKKRRRTVFWGEEILEETEELTQ